MELDRISALPDDLLAHILSYLSIRDTFWTSILSKRWEFLWLRVSVLDLTTVRLSLHQEQAMSKLLRRLLELNRGSCLQKFKIKFTSTCRKIFKNETEINFTDFFHEKKKIKYSSYINCNNGVMDLIAEVIHRGVQHLEADMSEIMPPRAINLMPKYVYVSKTLVSLKLVNVGLENPKFDASLPNLKIMHLEKINYENQGGLKIIKMLISASPLLEDLTFDFPDSLELKQADLGEDFRHNVRWRDIFDSYDSREQNEIDFGQNFSGLLKEVEDYDLIINVPQCLISTLEYVKINRLTMKEKSGIKLVNNYFLKKSAVLKKLTLSLSSVTNQELESYNKKLRTLTKLSPACQVIIDCDAITDDAGENMRPLFHSIFGQELFDRRYNFDYFDKYGESI